MPLYEYECQKCRNTFEVHQSIKDEPIKTCLSGECHGEVKKIISKSSFELKGNCWAKDQYSKSK